MLYLLYLLKEDFLFLNVFKHNNFRSVGAGVTAFLLSIVLGRVLIQILVKMRLRENIRADGPIGHQSKIGTPTMGGAFIVIAVAISTLLWVNLMVGPVWGVLLFTLGYGLIGLIYGCLKLTDGKGMR